MKISLAIYLGTPNAPARAAWGKLDEASRQQRMASGINAWGDWMTKHEANATRRSASSANM